jgi:hypothetical protein
MIAAGTVEWLFGVSAEGSNLEDVAPLSSAEPRSANSLAR